MKFFVDLCFSSSYENTFGVLPTFDFVMLLGMIDRMIQYKCIMIVIL